MVSITIDGFKVKVNKNLTILQACDDFGVEVPRFCFQGSLSIAGNCRMCLVEMEKSLKPVVSCILPVFEGMNIYTKTAFVKKSQESVLEFLLLNHPLDCPICDQGGECDLQDQSFVYGSNLSRFYEYKRFVEDKNCSFLVKMIMTRCIHCTRCVRFLNEIAGSFDLGTVGRGSTTEIGIYTDNYLDNELSGNVIDLCPVGALTSKPYAFVGRSWELSNVNSIDIMDGCGNNIVLSVKGNEVLRILPFANSEINETWITDKARFVYDSLKYNRLDSPFRRSGEKFEKSDWKNSFLDLQNQIKGLKGNEIGGLFGKLTDLDTLDSLKYFLNKLGSSNISFEKSDYGIDVDFESNFLLNNKIIDLKEVDVCLLVNTNLRFEASSVNINIREQVTKGNLIVGYIGPKIDLGYEYVHLGLGLKTFYKILEGRHSFCKSLKKSLNPKILLGLDNNLQKFIGSSNFNLFNKLIKGSSSIGLENNIFGLISSESSLVGGFYRNVHSSRFSKKDLKLVFLIEVENFEKSDYSEDCVFVYIGSHNDDVVKKVDFVLPSTSFAEKSVSYLNIEGRLQRTQRCVNLGKNVKDSWEVFKALSIFFGFGFNLEKISKTKIGFNNHLSAINSEPSVYKNTLFNKNIENFYTTNILARKSKTLLLCSKKTSKLNLPE